MSIYPCILNRNLSGNNLYGGILCIGVCIHSAASSYWGVLGFVRHISSTSKEILLSGIMSVMWDRFLH